MSHLAKAMSTMSSVCGMAGWNTPVNTTYERLLEATTAHLFGIESYLKNWDVDEHFWDHLQSKVGTSELLYCFFFDGIGD